MYEISKSDNKLLEYYITNKNAYKGAVYDFTFENRYIIYHAPMRNEMVYIALDMQSSLSSEICTTRNYILTEAEYEQLLPRILYSIKYTGDKRYLMGYKSNPEKLIEHIFRNLLPKYGYSVREEQIQLCKKMYKGLLMKKAAICESEVGTGKSLAYLIAAYCAKLSRDSNEPITISTSSIELQNAIIEKEIPRLSDILLDARIIQKPLYSILRKGKEHYFCPLRCKDYMEKISKNPIKNQAVLKLFEKSKISSHAFDLDKITIPGYLKGKICVKGNCTKCSMSDNCRYASFSKKALSPFNSFDFQVTNHNLYLMSAKHPGILRKSSFVIFDEAHKLKEAAQTVFGERLGEHTITKYLNWTSTQCSNKEALNTYRELRIQANTLNSLLFSKIKSTITKDSQNDENIIININAETIKIIQRLYNTIKSLEAVRKSVKGLSEVDGKLICNSLLRLTDVTNMNIWIETEDNRETILCCANKNIGNVLRENVWSLPRTYVFTSGTMSDGTGFDFFKKEIGLDRIGKLHLSEHSNPSPFNYSNHTRLYIPKDIPSPNNDDEEYLNAVADNIINIVNATNGHTAILFTSYKLLSRIYALTCDRLSKYEVIRMTHSDRLGIAKFKKSPNGVLFASGSMWEGVNCVGDCLSSVIIVRLPFPIRSAVMNEKKTQSSTVNDFIDTYVLPEMLIKLRQGVGRLIRSEKDTGIISILDRRALYSSYTDRIQNVLSKYPQVETIEDIKEFFKQIKTKEYFET